MADDKFMVREIIPQSESRTGYEYTEIDYSDEYLRTLDRLRVIIEDGKVVVEVYYDDER